MTALPSKFRWLLRLCLCCLLLSGGFASAPLPALLAEPATPLGDTSIFPVTATGVLAEFDFSGNVEDSSGNNRHATLLGGDYEATYCGSALNISDTLTEAVGLDWSAYAGLLVPPFTIEMVLTPQETSGYAKLFSHDDADDTGWYYLDEGFRSYRDGDIVGGSLMLPGDLHYLALVVNSDTLDVYFQGAYLDTTELSFTTPISEAVFFRDDSATARVEQFYGTVEALRISSVARTADEIREVNTRMHNICYPYQAYLPLVDR